MESLAIDNFLSIKRARIELKKINIFIGPQAKGKSLISKITSFCKELPNIIFEGVNEEKTKRVFDKDLKLRFESIFPSYGWENQDFKITYANEYYHVEIKNTLSNSKNKLCIEYSDSIKRSLTNARKIITKNIPEDEEVRLSSRLRITMNKDIRDAIATTLMPGVDKPRVEQVIYIPAGRSFFANLQKTVFSFISSSIPIDHFLKEFGALYERTRDPNFQNFVLQHRPKQIQRLVNDLICGNYVSEKGHDWIISDSGKVNVSNSSSGQQEALPMAMVLSTWPYAPSSIYRRSFIIEEPEAHLFPIAQGQIASIIASAYNARAREGNFTITTHSPYILTAINNLIQAGNVLRIVDNAKDRDRVFDIVPKDQIINFEHVAAYLVDKGTVKNLMDYENMLINAESIDVVSEHFSSKFEKLISLEMEYNQEDEGSL
jgi:hypothetical protein